MKKESEFTRRLYFNLFYLRAKANSRLKFIRKSIRVILRYFAYAYLGGSIILMCVEPHGPLYLVVPFYFFLAINVIASMVLIIKTEMR